METKIRIAFAGYAGCGKDTAAQRLIQRGFTRCCFGDIIKLQLLSLVKQHLGFSTFTDDREQKAQIRGLCEQWGEANYDNITELFFRKLPPLAVNTRIVRLREAKRWVEEGGYIIMIHRIGVYPATTWEADRVDELSAWIRENPGQRGISIRNDGTVFDLLGQVDRVVADRFSPQGLLLHAIFDESTLPSPDKVIASFMASEDCKAKLPA